MLGVDMPIENKNVRNFSLHALPHDVSEKTSNKHVKDKAESIHVKDKTESITETKEAKHLHTVIDKLPENEAELDPKFIKSLDNDNLEETKKVLDANIVETPVISSGNTGEVHFERALKLADKHKTLLGAKTNEKRGKINSSDHRRTLFGIPISAVKEFFADKVIRKWKPLFFWKGLAKLVHADISSSKYKDVTITVKRFGLLIKNKDKILEPLKNYANLKRMEKEGGLTSDLKQALNASYKDALTYMHQITGLTWHPNLNSAGVEIAYIELVELFFDKYLTVVENLDPNNEEEKVQLLDFFNAINGVCFEAKARNIEEYMLKYPLPENKLLAEALSSIFDPATPPMALVASLHEKLQNESEEGAEVIIGQLMDLVEKTGLIGFEAEDGPVSLEIVQNYLAMTLGFEGIAFGEDGANNYLNNEFKIFTENGGTTKEEFINQVKERIEANGGDEDIFEPILSALDAYSDEHIKA